MKLSSSQQYALLTASICLVLSYLLPNFTQPWPSFYREMMAYGFVFFLYWALLPAFDKSIPIPRSLWLIGLCLLIVMVQYISGMILFRGDLLVIVPFLIAIALAFICGTALTKEPSAQTILTVLCAVLLGIALFSAFLALVQWFGIGHTLGLWVFFIIDAPTGGRIVANMGQPNHLATLLVMGFAASIYLFHLRKISIVLLLLCATLLAIVSALTESKTGFLSIIVVTGFILFASWKTNSKNQGIIWISLYWCALTLLTFIFLNEIKYLLLLGESSFRFDASTGSRLSIYRQTWHGISQQPWTGYGWLNTLSAVRIGAEDLLGYAPATYSHNLFLDILAWNGIPLGLVIIGALLYWGISRYFVRLNQETFLICAVTLPFWVHSMTEFPFAFAYFTLPVAVLCGYIDAAGNRASRDLFQLNKKAVSLAVLSTAVLGGFALHAYYLAEKQFLRVRMLNKGIILSQPYQNKKIPLFNQIDAFIKAAEIHPKKDMSTDDVALMGQVSLRFPSALLESRYLLSLILTKQYDLYRRELTSIRNIHDDAFGYGVNAYITANPDVPDDIKQETTKILQAKITEFQSKQYK